MRSMRELADDNIACEILEALNNADIGYNLCHEGIDFHSLADQAQAIHIVKEMGYWEWWKDQGYKSHFTTYQTIEQMCVLAICIGILVAVIAAFGV